MPNAIAVRVARRFGRHAGAVAARRFRVEFGNAARLTADELRRALEPDVGLLTQLTFGRSPTDPATVTWEAVTEEGQVISGTFLVHTTVAEDQLSVWAEAVADRR